MTPIRESRELDWSGEHMTEQDKPQAREPRKENAASHSPLPWRRAGGMIDGYCLIDAVNSPVTIHRLPSGNATFIVEACNNFERVKAERDSLKDALALMTEHHATFEVRRQRDEIMAQRDELLAAVLKHRDSGLIQDLRDLDALATGISERNP